MPDYACIRASHITPTPAIKLSRITDTLEREWYIFVVPEIPASVIDEQSESSYGSEYVAAGLYTRQWNPIYTSLGLPSLGGFGFNWSDAHARISNLMTMAKGVKEDQLAELLGRAAETEMDIPAVITLIESRREEYEQVHTDVEGFGGGTLTSIIDDIKALDYID